MIIYDVNHWVPTDVNMLTIAGYDNDYYYVHRSLYDQAVVLDYLYHDDVDKLIYAITGSYESRDDVTYFMENTPRPLSIFGPFLLLVKEMLAEYTDMVGAIHVMAGPVNLCKMVEIDPSMRNTPRYSLSIKEEYELAWNRFFQTVIPYTPEMYTGGITPMNGTQTVVVSSGEDPDPSTMPDDEYEAMMLALLNPGDDIFDMPIEEETEETGSAVEEQPVVTQPGPTTVLPPTPEPVVEESEQVPDTVLPERMQGLAAILGGVL